MEQTREQIGPLSSDSTESPQKGSSTGVLGTAGAMLGVIVGIPAFIALLIECHRWLRTLNPGERVWPLVGMCLVAGAAATIAALDRERRAVAACSGLLAVLGVGLVLTAGEVRLPSPRIPTPPSWIGGVEGPADHKSGGSKSGHGDGRPISNAAYVAPRKSSARKTHSERTSGRKHATPVHSAPTEKAPATKSSVVQEASGKRIAQATEGSYASVGGGERPSAPATTPKAKSAPATKPQSTTQKAEGEEIAQSSGESEAIVSKGSGFRHVALGAARRWASASEGLALSTAHSASAAPIARASSTSHRRRKCHRRHCKRKRRPAASLNQQAQGRGIAQANGHSTAIVGDGNPINSNNPTNSNNGNVTVEPGSCGTNVQRGSTGAATVSGNTEGGDATSGDVTNEFTPEGEGCNTNVQYGSTGSATVSGNTEGGNATSGSIENTA
jgi:hypothetical protein